MYPRPDIRLSTEILQAKAVTKRFGAMVAVDRVDFTLREFEVAGIILAGVGFYFTMDNTPNFWTGYVWFSALYGVSLGFAWSNLTASSLVGLGEGASGHRRHDAQHLLVEDDNPAGLGEYRFEVGMGVGRRCPALPPDRPAGRARNALAAVRPAPAAAFASGRGTAGRQQ